MEKIKVELKARGMDVPVEYSSIVRKGQRKWMIRPKNQPMNQEWEPADSPALQLALGIWNLSRVEPFPDTFVQKSIIIATGFAAMHEHPDVATASGPISKSRLLPACENSLVLPNQINVLEREYIGGP